MNHQLILFYGAASGMGKSTLSALLYDQLRLHHIPVRWLYEDDVAHLPAFAEVVRGFQGSDLFDPYPALLGAATAFMAEYRQASEVILTDSIFPCWDWLFPGAPTLEQMIEFTAELAQILTPLQPLLIYLDGDIGTALRRAVEQRGQPWLDELIPWMNTWTQNTATPIYGIEGIIGYSEARRSQVLQLLNHWPHACLRLDPISHPIEQCQQTIADYLGLTLAQVTVVVPIATLQQYVGVYLADVKDDRQEKQLEIQLIDNALYVNAYWPKGCRLVPEGEAMFRLQATNEWLEFGAVDNRLRRELVYWKQGQSYCYVCRDGVTPLRGLC